MIPIVKQTEQNTGNFLFFAPETEKNSKEPSAFAELLFGLAENEKQKTVTTAAQHEKSDNLVKSPKLGEENLIDSEISPSNEAGNQSEAVANSSEIQAEDQKKPSDELETYISKNNNTQNEFNTENLFFTNLFVTDGKIIQSAENISIDSENTTVAIENILSLAPGNEKNLASALMTESVFQNKSLNAAVIGSESENQVKSAELENLGAIKLSSNEAIAHQNKLNISSEAMKTEKTTEQQTPSVGMTKPENTILFGKNGTENGNPEKGANPFSKAADSQTAANEKIASNVQQQPVKNSKETPFKSGNEDRVNQKTFAPIQKQSNIKNRQNENNVELNTQTKIFNTEKRQTGTESGEISEKFRVSSNTNETALKSESQIRGQNNENLVNKTTDNQTSNQMFAAKSSSEIKIGSENFQQRTESGEISEKFRVSSNTNETTLKHESQIRGQNNENLVNKTNDNQTSNQIITEKSNSNLSVNQTENEQKPIDQQKIQPEKTMTTEKIAAQPHDKTVNFNDRESTRKITDSKMAEKEILSGNTGKEIKTSSEPLEKNIAHSDNKTPFSEKPMSEISGIPADKKIQSQKVANEAGAKEIIEPRNNQEARENRAAEILNDPKNSVNNHLKTTKNSDLNSKEISRPDSANESKSDLSKDQQQSDQGGEFEKNSNEKSNFSEISADKKGKTNSGDKENKINPFLEVNTAKKASNSVSIAEPKNIAPANLQEVINKIEKLLTHAGSGKLNGFTFDSKELGKMEITTVKQQNKEEQGVILVESEAVKQQIQKHIPDIQDNLQQKGVMISAINVEVNTKNENSPEKNKFRNIKNTRKINEINSQQIRDVDTRTIKTKNYGYNTMEILA